MACEQIKSQLEQLRSQQAEAQAEFRDLVGSAKGGSALRGEILALGKKIAAEQAKLNQCLANQPVGTVVARTTEFHPETDGFLFNNSWAWDSTEDATMRKLMSEALVAAEAALGPIIAPFLLPALALVPFPFDLIALAAANGKIVDAIATAVEKGDNGKYGLCGGMVFASLDYWHRHWVVPQGKNKDDHPQRTTPQGKQLRDYIWTRLINSLQLNAVTFLKWMGMVTTSGGLKWLVDQTSAQLGTLRSLLGSGTPVPLGLVGTTSNPFENHQVLCYGYKDEADGTTSLFIYDENRPNAESIIRLDVRGSVLKVVQDDTLANAATPARGPLRGVFCEVYTPAEPPKSVVLRHALQVEPATAGINQPISIHYTAANVGYGSSNLNLVVSTDQGTFVGEASPAEITMGGQRDFAWQLKLARAGNYQIAAVAEQSFGPNQENRVLKVMPPEVSGLTETVTVTIKA